jgi:hypothetical protein
LLAKFTQFKQVLTTLTFYDQIPRYFTLRERSVYQRQEGEFSTWFVEPFATIIRHNDSIKWLSSSHIAIDKSVKADRGRPVHKIELKNKPISEGYKAWALSDNGRAWNWLWHSHRDGPEAIPKSDFPVAQRVYPGLSTVHLASTLALVARLAMHLRQQHPNRVFVCVSTIYS